MNFLYLFFLLLDGLVQFLCLSFWVLEAFSHPHILLLELGKLFAHFFTLLVQAFVMTEDDKTVTLVYNGKRYKHWYLYNIYYSITVIMIFNTIVTNFSRFILYVLTLQFRRKSVNNTTSLVSWDSWGICHIILVSSLVLVYSFKYYSASFIVLFFLTWEFFLRLRALLQMNCSAQTLHNLPFTIPALINLTIFILHYYHPIVHLYYTNIFTNRHFLRRFTISFA